MLNASQLGTSLVKAAGPSTQQINASRAVAVYKALQKYFSVTDGTALYRETYPWSAGNKYSYLAMLFQHLLLLHPYASSTLQSSIAQAMQAAARLERQQLRQAHLMSGEARAEARRRLANVTLAPPPHLS